MTSANADNASQSAAPQPPSNIPFVDEDGNHCLKVPLLDGVNYATVLEDQYRAYVAAGYPEGRWYLNANKRKSSQTYVCVELTRGENGKRRKPPVARLLCEEIRKTRELEEGRRPVFRVGYNSPDRLDLRPSNLKVVLSRYATSRAIDRVIDAAKRTEA
jgi:hypothetical protein